MNESRILFRIVPKSSYPDAGGTDLQTETQHTYNGTRTFVSADPSSDCHDAEPWEEKRSNLDRQCNGADSLLLPYHDMHNWFDEQQNPDDACESHDQSFVGYRRAEINLRTSPVLQGQ